MKPFAKRAQTTSVSLIKEVAAQAHKDSDIISLSQGIPSFSTPKHIREGVAKALLADEPGIGKYSVYMGTDELRRAIADKLSKEFSKDVDWETNIFVCAGAVEGLAAVVLSLVDPGDEVIIPSPDYGPHFQHLHLAQAKTVLVPLDEKNNWSWNIPAVEEAITPKTKLLFFTNPGNPVGNVFDKEALERLAALAKEHDLWVIVDETYNFLTYDGTPFIPSATIADFSHRLIVARSFSKEYAMTGWRLGFIYGPEKVIKESLKMHDPMVIAASTISQKAGVIALTGDQSCVGEMVVEYQKRRDYFCSLLDTLSPHITYTKPDGAYYVFARVSPNVMKKFGPTSIDFAFRMLREAKVAVVPGLEFKPPEDCFIRFSFGPETTMMEEAVSRIKKWLK